MIAAAALMLIDDTTAIMAAADVALLLLLCGLILLPIQHCAIHRLPIHFLRYLWAGLGVSVQSIVVQQ